MRRRAQTAFAFFATLVLAAGVVRAEGLKSEPVGEHPRIPSQAQLPRALIYEQGAPAQRERGATVDRAKQIAEGRELYDTHCITCHGADLRGMRGVPSLANAGGASVDFFVGTGRMPDALRTQQAVHTAPHFGVSAIAAIDAYVSSRAATIVPIPSVVRNDDLLQHGRVLFEANCQACHGAAGEGATIGTGWIALPLYSATPTQIGEAIRIGPGLMPPFTTAQLSDRDIDAIATYIRYLTVGAPSYGGLTLDNLGPAAEGLIGGILGVGALFWVIFFTGTKADGTRLHEK